MSYFVADVRGYVGDLASGGGLHALYQWLGRRRAPEIRELLKEGFTERPAETAVALRRAAGDDPAEAQTSARLLADLLDRCVEIGIITDGVEDDSAGRRKARKRKKDA